MTDETREAIGTVWHTTEKGKDIVSMHDAQYRALVEYIATLEAAVADRDEAIRVLAKDLYNCINGLPRQDSYIAVVADEIADVALAEASSETTGENA